MVLMYTIIDAKNEITMPAMYNMREIFMGPLEGFTFDPPEGGCYRREIDYRCAIIEPQNLASLYYCP
jgi:hypothetical protein